jgi:hypothetical protein
VDGGVLKILQTELVMQKCLFISAV